MYSTQHVYSEIVGMQVLCRGLEYIGLVHLTTHEHNSITYTYSMQDLLMDSIES